jgi:hypothetical protein
MSPSPQAVKGKKSTKGLSARIMKCHENLASTPAEKMAKKLFKWRKHDVELSVKDMGTGSLLQAVLVTLTKRDLAPAQYDAVQKWYLENPPPPRITVLFDGQIRVK